MQYRYSFVEIQIEISQATIASIVTCSGLKQPIGGRTKHSEYLCNLSLLAPMRVSHQVWDGGGRRALVKSLFHIVSGD